MLAEVRLDPSRGSKALDWGHRLGVLQQLVEVDRLDDLRQRLALDCAGLAAAFAIEPDVRRHITGRHRDGHRDGHCRGSTRERKLRPRETLGHAIG